MRITMRDSLTNVEAAGKAKRIANNTFEYHKPDGTRVVRLHQTDILEFRPDGRIILNSGGWKTVTTKDRLNANLPREYRVYSDRGLWRVFRPSKTEWCPAAGDQSVPFSDGMILPDAFAAPTAKAEKAEKAQRKLAKEITAFVARIDKLKSLPMPDSGDCWLCIIYGQQPHNHTYCGFTSRTGDRADNTDHLLEHVKEGYLHGTLLINAMRWAGYQDQGIGIHYHLNNRRAFKSSLRRYLRSQLGLPT